jgi:hypothetical protein
MAVQYGHAADLRISIAVHPGEMLLGYSGSPIGVLRKQTVKWLFPQEKATFDKASSA